jgi:FG-GAP-like repeat
MLRKIACLWVFLTFAVVASAQTQAVFFQPPVLLPANGVVSVAAVADLNGDGKLDVVYIDGTVLLAKADGTYQTGTAWCSMGQPYCGATGNSGVQAVVAADVNEDGKQDLLVATSNFVWVLLGKGDGTFQAAVSSVTGTTSTTLLMADVNGDGKPDAVLDPQGGTVSICLGKGDGTFQAGIAGPTTPAGTYLVGVTDLNGDHKADLVAVPRAGSTSVSVFTGNGDGTFSNTAIVTNAGLPSSNDSNFDFQLADMDGDGKLDVVASQYPIAHLGANPFDPTEQPQGTFVALGKGDGTFANATQIATRGGLISVGDLNGDGVADLILVGPDVDVLTGTGGGAVTLKASYFASTVFNTRAVIADFNGDGKADAFTGGALLFGNGDGTLKASPVTYFASAGAPAVAADFNQDGKVDLAVPGFGQNENVIHILLGDGKGGFAPGFTSPTLSTQTGLSVIQAADVNGDGKIDLVVGESGQSAWGVYVLTGNGDGTFNSPVEVAQSSQFNLISLVLSDLNNDHKLDLIVSDSSGAINVFLGNGDGTFAASSAFFGGLTTGVSLVAGDFNGDGKADLIVGIGTGLNLLPGKGDGTFGTAVAATSLIGGVTAAGDFNGDGILDLCQTSTVVLGNGDGTFRTGSTISNDGVPVGQVIYTIAVDLNGDGKVDLVGYSGGSQTESGVIRYALGNGDGTFTPVTLERPFFNASFAGPLVGDVNGDGRPDILFFDNNSIVSVLNDQPPAAPDFSATLTSPSSSTVSAGQSTTFGFDVAPMAGFAQTVSFTCSGTPANSTCTVSPNSAKVSGSTPVAIKVTVATTANSLVFPMSFKTTPRAPQLPVGRIVVTGMLAILLAMSVGFAGSSRRLAPARFRWATAACGLTLAAASLLLVSCGGGGSSPSGAQANPGTATGSYTIKVTGTSGSGASAVSHTVTFTLTVQ